MLEHLYLETTEVFADDYSKVSGRHAINPLLTSLLIPSDLPLLPKLRKLTYDAALKCDWSLLLTFSANRSPKAVRGLLDNLQSGNFCQVSLRSYGNEFCRDAFFDELKHHEDKIHTEFWQKWH